MQYYTSQQLEGAGRFSGTCRVGNWNEELELQEAKLKNFLDRNAKGELTIDKFNARIVQAEEEQKLTPAEDGFVHIGGIGQLKSTDSDASLACDISECEPRQGENNYSVSGAKVSCCTRSTFIMEKYQPRKLNAYESIYDDDILRYGQKIRLVANPKGNTEEDRSLYLFSKPVSTLYFAKLCKKQYVGLTTSEDTYDSVWQVLTVDPAQRTVSEGVEVLLGAPVALIHCATNQGLTFESTQTINNDFGKEMEVSCSKSDTQSWAFIQ